MFRLARYAVLMTGISAALAAFAEPQAVTADGRLAGRSEDGLAVYRGIPYAAPPVGELRWRAPQPLASWQGLRPAQSFGDDCVQIPMQAPPGPGFTRPQSEDCLYLNVWAPQRKQHKPLPVMVWIHGGAFIMGSGAWPCYDGRALARQGVVVVTLNYRLGRFGFFAHPALSAADHGEPLGNYGLLDQMAALRWVRHNIAAFGGDPRRVTVFGESGGATSVNALLASPSAAGLFDQAISESGASDRELPTLRQAESAGKAWALAEGIDADDAARLRALPADAVQRSTNAAPAAMSPIVDGRTLGMSPGLAFQRGLQHKMPYLVGSNSYEYSLLRWMPQALDGMHRQIGTDLEAALAPYLRNAQGQPVPRDLAEQQLWGDYYMVSPAHFLAERMSAAGEPVWLYRFSYVPVARRGQVAGTPHGGELPYVFGNVAGPSMYGEGPQDGAMARTASAYWVRFARTGNPNGGGAVRWTRYAAGDEPLLDFTDDGPLARRTFDGDKMAFLQRLRLQRFSGSDVPTQ